MRVFLPYALLLSALLLTAVVVLTCRGERERVKKWRGIQYNDVLAYVCATLVAGGPVGCPDLRQRAWHRLPRFQGLLVAPLLARVGTRLILPCSARLPCGLILFGSCVRQTTAGRKDRCSFWIMNEYLTCSTSFHATCCC